MTKDQVVRDMKRYLDRLIGVKVTSLQSEYKRDLLRLFNEANIAGAMIPGDALWNSLEERYPDDMQDQRYIDLFKKVQTSWDEWCFYVEHHAEVAH